MTTDSIVSGRAKRSKSQKRPSASPAAGQRRRDQLTSNPPVPKQQRPTADGPDDLVPAFPPDDEAAFTWDIDQAPQDLYPRFGSRLAASGDLYRRPGCRNGLLCVCPDESDIEVSEVTTAVDLASVIVDRVRLQVIRGGKVSRSIPAADLRTMLGSKLFLREFRSLDLVVGSPMYLPDYHLTQPGYNDGGPGQRILYLGKDAKIERGLKAILDFLEVMAFNKNADRTNAVALALTVMLRNFWPGAKPIGIITSTKSHGGKDTIVTFAAGATPKVSVDYQSTDWAFRDGLIAALSGCPDAGVVNLENARLTGRNPFFASGTLERCLTERNSKLHSTKLHNELKLNPAVVFMMTTNHGKVSQDLLNRGLPIHLNPIGNVADRRPAIGNPKYEYLPRYCDQIGAELRGMYEKWKAADRPLDLNVRHPFTSWAQTIGGILQVNGFEDFLGNYNHCLTWEDPEKQALGRLGACAPGVWLTLEDWVPRVAQLGLTESLISRGHRESPESRRQGLGDVMSAHDQETFVVETESEILEMRLEWTRRRFDGGQPTRRYRFEVLERRPLPAKEDNQ